MLRKPFFHQHVDNRRATPIPRVGSPIFCCFFLFLCTLVVPPGAFGQPTGTPPPIACVPTDALYPQEFYVAGVTDVRADRKAVATCWHPGPAPTAVRPVDLQGGRYRPSANTCARAYPATPNYARAHPPQEYRVTESAGTGNSVNGEVAVAVSFHLKRRADTLDLVSYRGGIRYARSPNQTATVEQALRQSLVGAVQYLDNG
jgi:hypothetical protein